MREIKFRAWDYKKMIMPEDLYIIIDGEEKEVSKIVLNDNGMYSNELLNYELMQYTGLKDIEGKEIYEGDIVEKEFVDFSNRDKFIGIIKFIDGCWCIENENKKRAYFLFNETDINSVIGNIYENPGFLNKI